MNWKIIFTIAKKDITEARQNKSVWLPILIVPIFFILIIPLGMIIGLIVGGPAAVNFFSDPDLVTFLDKMPPVMSQVLQGLDSVQSILILVLGYMFAPFFLIMPLMYSTVIASESFAGEKERKTVEALLYTPVSDTELFIGKVMASFLPAVGITWACFLGYIIVLNAAGWPLMHQLWFPLVNWYPLILWVSPAISLLGIAVTVLISAKVNTFMGAYQSSASLVVLVLALLVGQITGVLYLSALVGLLLGLLIWAAGIVLMVVAIRTFNREKLLVSSVS
jgi:ABC-type Na+ efflux pump permease subunit